MIKRIRFWLRSRRLAKTAIDTRYALLEACFIGVISAIAALALKEGIVLLGKYRVYLAHHYAPLIGLPLFGFGCCWLSGWLIDSLAPAARGGGVPQVKAVLARFPLPLSWQVGVIKILGTILALGGGLPLGRRGPTIHIGAALAAHLSEIVPTSPEHRRQLIAAGAAAGLAAGFNTPIAGVLFVIEELMRDISGLTLETAILASFTGAVVSRFLGSADLNLPPELLQNASHSGFTLAEIPFFLMLGVLAGLLGGIFNRSIIAMQNFNSRLPLSMPWRLGVVGLLVGVVMAFLPPSFQDNAGLTDFLVQGHAGVGLTALAFVAHFCLSIVCYGAGTPGGLFAPALVLGAALGYGVGIEAELFLPVATKASFAVAGMAGFFTAVARVPITAIVIVFELTTDFNLVLPLMLTSAMAFLVAEGVSQGSIYEHLLEASGIHLPDDHNDRPNHVLTSLKAADVMQREVETLPRHLPFGEVLQLMSRSPHRGFPVVDNDRLVGIITQSDLPTPDPEQSFVLADLMTKQPITVKPQASLSDVLYLLNRYQLSRLPVAQGQKLLGIITRTDIIRAEVKHLRCSHQQEHRYHYQPSYVVYRTCGPAVGRGKILIPVANPKTADLLLAYGAAIAHYYRYELECLQIIVLPKHNPPSQTTIRTSRSRRLLHHLERLGEKWQISVHTQVKVSHNLEDAILETINQENIKLLLMGWRGTKAAMGSMFQDLVHDLLEKAPCDLMLIKAGAQFDSQACITRLRWLLPVAPGPHCHKALEFLPAFSQFADAPQRPIPHPEVFLCEVAGTEEKNQDFQTLERAFRYLEKKLRLPVVSLPMRSGQTIETILNLAKYQGFDAIILGASRKENFSQVFSGSLHEAITTHFPGTVIIVKEGKPREGDRPKL